MTRTRRHPGPDRGNLRPDRKAARRLSALARQAVGRPNFFKPAPVRCSDPVLPPK